MNQSKFAFSPGFICRHLPLCIVLAALLIVPSGCANFPKFASHTIDNWGYKLGQTSLADIDKDGDLDWVVGARDGDIMWYEYRSPDDWVQHKLGGNSPTDVGGTAFDVDGDGWLDQVSGQAWYQNPQNPRSREFIKKANGAVRTHDNVAADIDGDGKLDLVAMADTSAIYWYKIPTDPTDNWQQHYIGKSVHGGIDPRGIGDIDGDGDNDIVRSTGWFENKNSGTSWSWHGNIDGGSKGKYPDTTKSWIIDMDGDGDNDVVMSSADSELGTGWVKWFENIDGKGLTWSTHIVAAKKGDMHSLAVFDFDNDGDADIFSGEGPLGGTGPNEERRTFIWENTDGKGGTWTEHILTEGYRCHEAMAGDVDGDGDIDICFKPWNGDLHIYLENKLIKSTSP